MSSPTIAVFGATGGCAGYCLANCLNAGYDCVALARTPAKLTQAMRDKGVGTAALDQHLQIVQGDAKDVEAVKSALHFNGKIANLIVSGVGGTPFFRWNLVSPVSLNDPTICQDAGEALLEALTQLNPNEKPVLLNVSTTGIQPQGKPRDVPILFLFLYHYMLHVPHEDKRVWEQRLTEHMQLPEHQRGLKAFVHVKPSLLMDGAGHGLNAVRQGTDEQPAVGYTIQRGDVGLFMFERLIKSGVREEWQNKSLTVTY